MAEYGQEAGGGSRRAVFVTGASRGVGLATALRLDKAGYQVFAAVRREQDVRHLRDAAGPHLRPVLLDLRDTSALHRAVRDAMAAMEANGLTALVNNAAAFHAGPLEFVTAEDMKRLFDTNVFGPLQLIQACLPLLRPVRGRIINISSPAGKVALPFMAPLSASKAALESLSDALRIELAAQGIETIVLQPGRIASTLGEELRDRGGETLASLPDIGRNRYGRALEKFRAGATMPAGLTPGDVAALVQRAIEVPRPRPRYSLGREKILLTFARWLPQPMLDRMIRKAAGL